MRALHLFDETADWEQRIAVTQLLSRISAEEGTQFVASLDTRAPPGTWFNGTDLLRTPSRFGLGFMAAPSIGRIIADHSIDMVFAWGPQAAIAAGAARTDRCALVLERFSPSITNKEAKAMNSVAHGARFAAVCSSETVRRRLIESGLPPKACVVIRPGVDFAAINAAKKNKSLRASFGLKPGESMILASHPIIRDGCFGRIVWSGHLVNYLQPSRRMVWFGTSDECKRVRSLSRNMPLPDANLWADPNCRYEDLIAIAECLVITPFGDVSTTPIAWAMAAGVPVVGSAVYAIAELIAHKHNGFLIKPERGPSLTVKINAALKQIDNMVKEKEVAKGQAYQVFGVRRFVDQHLQLYRNLTTGADPAHEIPDSAIEM